MSRADRRIGGTPALPGVVDARRTEMHVYEFEDDVERGRGRVVAILAVVLLGAGGWFVARPALSDDGDGRGGSGLALDAATTTTSTTTTSTTSTSSTSTTSSTTTSSTSTSST